MGVLAAVLRQRPLGRQRVLLGQVSIELPDDVCSGHEVPIPVSCPKCAIPAPIASRQAAEGVGLARAVGVCGKGVRDVSLNPSEPVVRILLIAVGSPEHYSQWNVLSCEALAGDLRGRYGPGVEVRILRIDRHADLASVPSTCEVREYDLIGLSPSLGAFGLLDQVWQRIASTPRPQGRPLIAIGNKVPTFFPDACLERYPEAVVVKGEAEHSFQMMVAHIRGQCLLQSIPNVMFVGARNQTIRGPDRRCDLSELLYPPSLDTVGQVVARGGNVLVQSSRGCPWSSCSYCTCRSFRKGALWEPLPEARVIANLEQLADVGAREFEFADDEFLGGRSIDNLSRAKRIGTAIHRISLQVGEKVSFRVFLEPTTIYREGDAEGNARIRQLLASLRTMGMNSVYVGVESGCHSQLRRFNRPGSLAEAVGALRTLRELRIHADLGFIMFDPWLTPDELRNNVTFFRAFGLIDGNQWPFRPLVANEGAPVKDALAESGLLRDPVTEFMAYGYRFISPTIESIQRTVDELSSRSRSLFYAVKTISKMRFTRDSVPLHVRLARELVTANALVYLDLLDRLLDCDRHSAHSAAVEAAKCQLDQLVLRVSRFVEDGLLPDHDNVLAQSVRCYLEMDRDGVASTRADEGFGAAHVSANL